MQTISILEKYKTYEFSCTFVLVVLWFARELARPHPRPAPLTAEHAMRKALPQASTLTDARRKATGEHAHRRMPGEKPCHRRMPGEKPCHMALSPPPRPPAPLTLSAPRGRVPPAPFPPPPWPPSSNTAGCRGHPPSPPPRPACPSDPYGTGVTGVMGGPGCHARAPAHASHGTVPFRVPRARAAVRALLATGVRAGLSFGQA